MGVPGVCRYFLAFYDFFWTLGPSELKEWISKNHRFVGGQTFFDLKMYSGVEHAQMNVRWVVWRTVHLLIPMACLYEQYFFLSTG